MQHDGTENAEEKLAFARNTAQAFRMVIHGHPQLIEAARIDVLKAAKRVAELERALRDAPASLARLEDEIHRLERVVAAGRAALGPLARKDDPYEGMTPLERKRARTLRKIAELTALLDEDTHGHTTSGGEPGTKPAVDDQAPGSGPGGDGGSGQGDPEGVAPDVGQGVVADQLRDPGAA